ncbi:Retrovirus-related Pol polyprotein from transposon TNT 1-94 [Eumeta japonica]|uniref:Retrovirus-related Pol polyprotein from transposon TNT 1-94 n=1 Tax=Eumeta variegata TaxID=151549 RepID=A0A4C1Z5J5_EUMVA|nr:Retrovirus-related Pol polyprotein from transposon TNT 1-94 [Eumeta japonica]
MCWRRRSHDEFRLRGYSEERVVRTDSCDKPTIIKNKVTISRDVIIQEKPKCLETVIISLESTDSVGELVEESVVKLESLNKSSSSKSDYLDVEEESLESEACGENLNTEQTSSAPQSTEEASDTPHEGFTTPVPEVIVKRQRRKPDRYGFVNICVTATGGNGLTYAEAISGPERLMWLQAMADELQSFQDNQAWEVVDTPSNASVVQCKWVFKKKFDSDNKVTYRARLVAKGFTQKAGIDYQETFSPVIRHSTLRLLFAISVQLGMDITHLDVKTSFLNGT